MTTSKRHHFSAQFYQRNFGDPMFSNNIRVYQAKTKAWDSQPRTPRGIGWFPHLYSMFNAQGERTDVFEDFLQRNVDGPAASAMKTAARTPQTLSQQDREAIAFFIGFAAARTPAMMNWTMGQYLSTLPVDQIDDFEDTAQKWCEVTGTPWSPSARKDFLKPSLLGATVVWATSIRDRVLKWNWHFVTTTPEHPFITSDWPVFARYAEDDDIRFISFPISSETALLVHSSGEIRSNIEPADGVRAINHQTMDRAASFVICHKASFPGDDQLSSWPYL